jgi:hypothetical protein
MMMLFYDEILPARSRWSNRPLHPPGEEAGPTVLDGVAVSDGARTFERTFGAHDRGARRARVTLSSHRQVIDSARVRAEHVFSAVQTEQLQGRSTD